MRRRSATSSAVSAPPGHTIELLYNFTAPAFQCLCVNKLNVSERPGAAGAAPIGKRDCQLGSRALLTSDRTVQERGNLLLQQVDRLEAPLPDDLGLDGLG